MSIYKRIRSFIGNHKSLNRVYTFFSVKIYGNMVVRIKQHRLQKYASELLFKFNRALSLAGCDYWLDYGTLLGAIREKGLIGHDLDLDTGMMYDERKPEMQDNLLNSGFKKIRQIEVNGRIAEETYQYKGLNIDVFYYSRIDEEHIRCFLFNPVKGLTSEDTIDRYGGLATRMITYRFIGLSEYTFLGVKVGIPENYDEYLTNCYGPTYMVPDPNFKYSNSPSVKYLDNVWGKVTLFR